jgi:hypothetical protein
MRLQTFANSFLLFWSVAVLSACDPPEDAWRNQNQAGYRPVYGAPQFSEIKLLAPQPVNKPGKIYVYGSYLLVNELKKGIHVFNNENPAQPQPLGFLQILGNTDMAVRNDILYADHLGNLVALQVSGFNQVQTLGTLPLKNWNLGVPPPAGFHFECVDPSKGLVVDWKKTENKNLDCYALQ